MKLTSDQVTKVAKLASLKISESELVTYSDQISHILDYIDQLNGVNTEDIVPIYNVTGLVDIWQEDNIKESLSQEDALANAPTKKDGLFITKGVFEE